jgi:hypothetical protein
MAMYDIADRPILDKDALVGGCLRLPIRVDVDRLQSEVRALPAELWGDTAGRNGIHSAANAIFVRGHAPLEGDFPVEDRPVLERLPYVRSILAETIPASPLRALLARLPAGAVIRPHVDLAAYFQKSLRVHVPIETNEQLWMLSAGKCYQMRPGEVWVLNNSELHGVVNGHASLPRIHLICDFLPDQPLIDLLADGDRDLGQVRPEVEEAARQTPSR